MRAPHDSQWCSIRSGLFSMVYGMSGPKRCPHLPRLRKALSTEASLAKTMQPSMPTTSLFETQPNQNLWLLKAALIKPMYRTPQLHKNSADMSVNPHACHEFTSSPLIVGIACRGGA
jgi:hypothetical protein